jgi:RNA polymerase sigma-70 factor (ECF subfamily)
VLGEIEPRHAQALLLWAEELSYQEIAAAMEVNLTSVGSLLTRAQAAFRKEFEKRHGSTK